MTSSEQHQRARRHALIVALACGVLYMALLIALFGLTELLTNTDIVAEEQIGEFTGPAMFGVAVIAFTAMLAVRGPRDSDDLLDWGHALLSGFVAMATYIVSAFVFGAIDRGLDEGLRFGVSTIFGGYDVIVGIVAFGVGLLYSLVIARRYDERGRPRWSWEDDFDV